MDKIDILIQRIDEEIARHKDMLTELALTNREQEFREIARHKYISTELALTNKDQEFRKILNANIKYLRLFKKMAIEVKEEM